MKNSQYTLGLFGSALVSVGLMIYAPRERLIIAISITVGGLIWERWKNSRISRCNQCHRIEKNKIIENPDGIENCEICSKQEKNVDNSQNETNSLKQGNSGAKKPPASSEPLIYLIHAQSEVLKLLQNLQLADRPDTRIIDIQNLQEIKSYQKVILCFHNSGRNKLELDSRLNMLSTHTGFKVYLAIFLTESIPVEYNKDFVIQDQEFRIKTKIFSDDREFVDKDECNKFRDFIF